MPCLRAALSSTHRNQKYGARPDIRALFSIICYRRHHFTFVKLLKVSKIHLKKAERENHIYFYSHRVSLCEYDFKAISIMIFSIPSQDQVNKNQKTISEERKNILIKILTIAVSDTVVNFRHCREHHQVEAKRERNIIIWNIVMWPCIVP